MGDGMAEEDDNRGKVFTLFMFLNNFTFPATWLVEKHNNQPRSVEQGSGGRGQWDGMIVEKHNNQPLEDYGFLFHGH